MRNKTHLKTCATPRKIWRALVTALSISILGTGILNSNSLIAYAYTVDDLREFAGMNRITTPEGKTRLSNIIYLYGEQQHNKEIMESINENDLDLSILENMKEAEAELEEINNSIKTKFKNASALDVVALYRQADTVSKKLQKYNPTGIKYNTNFENITEEEYKEAIELMTKTKDLTELGDIGRALKLPIESQQLIVIKPFGDILDSLNPDNIIHSNGLYMKNKKSGGQIKSLWNGTVKEVANSDEWGTYVVVKSGDSLEYSISFLNKAYVKEGDSIDQYDILGESNNDFIYLEVLLDDNYIDPLLLFGQKGPKAYYKWVSSNSDIVLEHNKYNIVKDYVEAPEYEYGNNKNNSDDTGIKVIPME